MDLGLKGRVVLITGAVKGMGAAITSAFAAEGCLVALLGRDLAVMNAFAAAFGDRALVLACDVTKADDCDLAVAQVVAHWGRIDVLVNVAGGAGPVGHKGWESSAEELTQILELNVTGCFNTMRAVMPTMIAKRYGKIVNVGGTFGMRGRAGRASYSASKWGLRGLTKSFAIEAGPHNININIVAPGMVDGERFRTKILPTVMAMEGLSEEEAVAQHAADYAMGRISTSEDIALACLFLASDVSRQITGVDLPVDGGWAAL